MSPLKKIREKMGWTKKNLADLLGNRSRVIGRIEGGRMRIPDKFYDPLRTLGVDPFQLAVEQEEFIQWRRKFYSDLRWGLLPSTI